jgi:hypothetical protein
MAPESEAMPQVVLVNTQAATATTPAPTVNTPADTIRKQVDNVTAPSVGLRPPGTVTTSRGSRTDPNNPREKRK